MRYGPFGMFGDGPSIIELTIQHWKIMGACIAIYSIFWIIKVIVVKMLSLFKTEESPKREYIP